MVWFAVCAVIVVLGAAYLFLQAREVWRKCLRLFEEIEAATVRLEAARHPQEQRVGSAVPDPGGA